MNCKNCHTELSTKDDYCKCCGGKVIRNRLTFGNLFEHISETFFNYDNKLLQTFIQLFKQPEEVIGGYINGTRKKYVNVISYFALAITISGFYLIIVKKYFPETMDFSQLAYPGQEEFQKKNMSFIEEYQSLLMMLYVPLYALMARVTFFNIKKYNYTELLVVFMYIQAQLSIASAIVVISLGLLGISSSIVGILMIPLMIIYSAYVLKRLLDLSASDIIVRTLLFFIVLGITMVFITIIMLVTMYFTGDLQEIFGPAFEAGKKMGEEASKVN
ncbi:DUF3667 domain-containing protein [Winogradskyella thalassocola]|uniref:Uncharacterized protein n=1 Tax=Winogradskyella thalassocola TaxID=262004 RepID=A0A1G8FDR3_9FLAO|nr:DUF3667 domain-containing protein [Winogradskyella thalassocola]SDH80253.1 Protein of unknown function [Winogradskyella thalassocola]